jgi:hypothetical protein
MRTLIILATLAISSPALADDTCPVKSTTFDDRAKAVAKAKTCEDAASIAEKCAFGSSADVQIAGAAIEVCKRDFARNKDDTALHDKLAKRCATKYEKMQGTIYISYAVFCQLDVAKLFSGLNRPAS